MCTATDPAPLSPDTASPEAACPPGHDTLGTSGWLPPAGYTVTLPRRRTPPATATASATAPAPVAGTPACPATGTVTVWPAPTGTLATEPPGSGTKPPPTDPNGIESSEPSGVVLLAVVADDVASADPAVVGPQAAREAAISAPPAVAARTARRECRQPHVNPTP